MSSTGLTPLTRLINAEQEAQAFGFDWPNQSTIIAQALDECAEIQAALAAKESPARLQEEIGDLLHAAISLCLFSGFSPAETLDKVSEKFEQRLAKLKMLAQQAGLTTLQGQSFEYMLTLWQLAKK